MDIHVIPVSDMFSVDEYKALLSEGVEATMVALTECAYKVLFEAAAPAKPGVALIPFPYEAVADKLNIDMSDCRSDDGTPNNSKMARKLSETPCFRAIEQKVGDIIDIGLDAACIGYRKPDGTIEYVYRGTEKSNDLKNIVENMKTVMIGRIAGIVSSRFSDDVEGAIEFVNRIDAGVAGKRLARMVIGRFHDLIIQKGLESGVVRQYDQGFDRSIVQPIKSSDIGVEGSHCIAKNSDGSEWWEATGLNTYDGIQGEVNVAWLMMTQSTNWEMYNYHMGAIAQKGTAVVRIMGNARVLEILDIGSLFRDTSIDDTVQVLDSLLTLGEHGFYNMISASFSCIFTWKGSTARYTWPEFLAKVRNILPETYHVSTKFLLYCRLAKVLIRNPHAADFVSPGACQYVYEFGKYLFEPDEIEETDSVLRSLACLVGCIESDMLDLDDLKEMANSGDDYIDVRDYIDLRTISRINHGTGTSLRDVLIALALYPDETLYGLSGGKDDGVNSTRHKNDYLSLKLKSGISKETPRRLNNPEYQVDLINTYSVEYFVDIIKMFADNRDEYVSISDDAMELILDKQAAETTKLATFAIIDYLYAWMEKIHSGKEQRSYEWLHKSDSGASVDARLAKRIQDDCRRILTPEFQETAYRRVCDANGNPTPESAELLDELRGIVAFVPGIRMSPKVLHMCSRAADQGERFNDAVDAKGLVRLIRYKLENDDATENMVMLFRRYALNPAVLDDVEKNTVWGRRLKDMYAKLYQSCPNDERVDLLLPLCYESVEPGELDDKGAVGLISYLRLYVEPIRDEVSELGGGSDLIISRLLKIYSMLFSVDEVFASKIFLDRKVGLFKCRTNTLRDVPGKDGKVIKKMVPIELEGLRLTLLDSYGDNMYDISEKANIALVGSCFAGYHILSFISPSLGEDESVGFHKTMDVLLNLSSWYDKGVEPGHRVIEPEELTEVMESYPDLMLPRISRVPPEIARELCQKYLTPEKLQKMSSTTEGLLMLIRLSAHAGWELFSRQFVRANEMNISRLINTLPPEEARELAEKVKELSGHSDQFNATGGVASASHGQSSIQYHVANGLNWMNGFVKAGGRLNDRKNATLFTADEAREFMASSLPNGWRLPTLAEIEHLGTDPEVVARKHLGFEPTGRLDSDGDLTDTFGCYAWCTSGDDLTAYSVVNNAVEPDDFMVDTATDALAIKLVQ